MNVCVTLEARSVIGTRQHSQRTTPLHKRVETTKRAEDKVRPVYKLGHLPALPLTSSIPNPLATTTPLETHSSQMPSVGLLTPTMPQPETLTLTKALVELKMLSKRIDKTLETLNPVAIKTGPRFESSIKSQAEFERDVRAAWQSIHDLQKRRRAIKTALVLANARTEVEVAGDRMTIAEAIERKSMLDLDRRIYVEMGNKLKKANDDVDKRNRVLEDRLTKLLEATYHGKDTVGKEDYERIAKPFREGNEAKLVDPLNCEKRIEALHDKTEQFFAEVDVCLSVANAKTEITISV